MSGRISTQVDRKLTDSTYSYTQRPALASAVGHSFAYCEPSALRLSDYFRPALRSHFRQLSSEDLYLRFGMLYQAEALDTYISGIDFRKSIVLGVFDDDLELIGTAHLSAEGGTWELGLSVLSQWRCHGVGSILLRRAMQQARMAKADSIFIHCLVANHALMRLVRKVGARVVESDGECEGIIALASTQSLSSWRDLTEEQIALFNFSMKAQLLMVRRVFHQPCGGG